MGRVCEDAPNPVTLYMAPPGYTVCHQTRKQSTGKARGGGVAVVCRDVLKMTAASNFSSAEFESLEVRVTMKSTSLTIVAVYRPPGTVVWYSSV